MTDKKINAQFLPLIAAAFAVLGLLLGKYLYEGSGPAKYTISGNDGKVDEVIETVVDRYIEPIDETEITDYTIRKLLEHLDPHSSYIPLSDVQSENERYQGNFKGIGIEFRIIEDTLIVVNAIENGPSETAGLTAGDRIIGLDGEQIELGKLETDSLIKLLRGEGGSKVDLMVFRPSEKSIKNYTVTRGEIPIYSVDASFKLTDEIGYVKLNRFSSKTLTEFKKAADELIEEGVKSFMIDVRGNPGGSLNAVVGICDEFLPEGAKILNTKGEHDNVDYPSTKDGDYMNYPVTILVDQNSASASEILAGALQDNDRASIVGRRTFGKGLVQAVIPLQDESMIHLTISHYYIPSGRCIQKPFEKDNIKEYRHESAKRWESGELYAKDSISLPDSLKFKTLGGRTVYGGGGIIPDVFVPYDTTGNSNLLFDLFEKDLIRDFVVKHYSPSMIEGNSVEESLSQINIDPVLQAFKTYSIKNDVKWNVEDWELSKEYVSHKLMAYLMRVKYRNNGYYKASVLNDNEIKAGLKVLEAEKE